MKNTFVYLEKEGCTKIAVRMDNLEQISFILKEMTKYVEQNIEAHIEKEGIFDFVFEKIDDNEQVVATINEADFFDKIVKDSPEIRPQVLAYAESIQLEKLEETTLLMGLDAMTALAIVDTKYYKDFEQFFKRVNISDEQAYKIEELTEKFNRIIATQSCDKAMMELMAGFEELFYLAEEDIELPQDIARESFNHLLKITLEKSPDLDDIEDVPYYIQAAFNKVFPYKDFFDCLYDTDINERFAKEMKAGTMPTYDTLLGLKANSVFYSVNDDGIEVIVDIKKEKEVKKVIELLCQLFKEEDMENIAYDIEFGKLQEGNKFEETHDESSFFSTVIRNYPNLQDTVLDYAFSLSTHVGDDNYGLPEGLELITKLAQTDKKYISEFGGFLLSRDLNHPSAGWQEREYVWEVLTEWDWCPEIIDLAVECFCTPAQWGPEEWLPIDNEIRPEVFNTFMKKLCDRRVYLHEKEAMVYDENFEVKQDYIYQEFYGIDDILENVFEDREKEDLYEQFNRAIAQNCYPTYEFFKGTS